MNRIFSAALPRNKLNEGSAGNLSFPVSQEPDLTCFTFSEVFLPTWCAKSTTNVPDKNNLGMKNSDGLIFLAKDPKGWRDWVLDGICACARYCNSRCCVSHLIPLNLKMQLSCPTPKKRKIDTNVNFINRNWSCGCTEEITQRHGLQNWAYILIFL